MTSVSIPASRFIGCDVGKSAIVVFDDTTGRTRTVANQPESLARFAAGLGPLLPGRLRSHRRL
jgi:hypothetical protein